MGRLCEEFADVPSPLRGPSCMILHRSFSEARGDPREVLFKRLVHDPAQVLVRRSCEDPGEILYKRSLREALAGLVGCS